jgi:hypothetical protein
MGYLLCLAIGFAGNEIFRAVNPNAATKISNYVGRTYNCVSLKVMGLKGKK